MFLADLRDSSVHLFHYFRRGSEGSVFERTPEERCHGGGSERWALKDQDCWRAVRAPSSGTEFSPPPEPKLLPGAKRASDISRRVSSESLRAPRCTNMIQLLSICCFAPALRLCRCACRMVRRFAPNFDAYRHLARLYRFMHVLSTCTHSLLRSELRIG